MRRYCCACGKQAIQGQVPAHDTNVTTLIGAKAGFRSDEVFCGHGAVALDENGLFPEERAQEEQR